MKMDRQTEEDLQSLRYCMVYSQEHDELVRFLRRYDPSTVRVRVRLVGIGSQSQMFSESDDLFHINFDKRQTVMLTEYKFIDTEWDREPRIDGSARIVSIALGARMLRLMDRLYAMRMLREL